MPVEDPRARIGYRGGTVSRAKQIVAQALIVLGGAIMLASALLISLVFFVVMLGVVLIAGGYLWWKTRDLRKQLRERMAAVRQQQGGDAFKGNIIEGEVIDSEVVPEDRPRR